MQKQCRKLWKSARRSGIANQVQNKQDYDWNTLLGLEAANPERQFGLTGGDLLNLAIGNTVGKNQANFAGYAANVQQANARIVLTSMNRTPALRSCAKASIMECLFNCASLGLIPNGARGHAYIIPYAQIATLQVGFKGFLEIAFRTGEVREIQADVVVPFTILYCSGGNKRRLSIDPSGLSGGGDLLSVDFRTVMALIHCLCVAAGCLIYLLVTEFTHR